ncbi:MAG: 2-oxo acid dehydrogenase subunit E2 [Pseudomonadota bacterium]
MSETVEIRVPALGDYSEVPVIDVPVAAGDLVALGDTLIIVESDKATLDVPADVAGTIVTINVAEGDLVGEGTVIATLAPAGETPQHALPNETPSPKAAKSEAVPQDIAEGTAQPEETTAPLAAPIRADPPSLGAAVHASPSIRRFARMLGVEIADVAGTGPSDRITREDVEAFVKSRLDTPATGSAHMAGLPPWPTVDHAEFGPVERLPLSRIAKISGPALARNAMLIPHVTNFEKADVTDLEAFRKAANEDTGPDGPKLTILAFAVKAVVSALKANPRFNASLDGDNLLIKHYFNIGVAADTPEGLVVPVIKGADAKGLHEIAAEMKTLADAARAGTLKSRDIKGATFTISSLGGIGGTGFTPIINAPEVAILGMPRSDIAPVWDGKAFTPRRIQPLALSFDHRVADGVAAARFLVHVASMLADVRRLLL